MFPRLFLAALTAVTVLSFGGCGGGGGGGGSAPPAQPVVKVIRESEPNNDPSRALVLPRGSAGAGRVSNAGDVDFWSFPASAGEVLFVEWLAVRRDQSSWSGNDNAPKVTLIAPNGNFQILQHDASGTSAGGWTFAKQDFDFCRFQADVSGLYFISITQDDPSRGGGRYVVQIDNAPIASLQFEQEPFGQTGQNDTAGSAELLQGSNLRGYHVDGESDYYALSVNEATILKARVFAHCNGAYGGDDSYFLPRLDLFSLDGQTLLATNNSTYFRDSGLSFLIRFPGVYFLRVGKCCGAGDSDYFLSLDGSVLAGNLTELEPNDTPGGANNVSPGLVVNGSIGTGDDDWYAFLGEAGDAWRVTQYDSDHRQGALGTVTVDFFAPDGTTPLSQDSGGTLGVNRTILVDDGIHFARVRTLAPNTDYSVQFELFLESDFESEPNDTNGTADSLDSGLASGVIEDGLDVDRFRFQAERDDVVIISVFAAPSEGSDGYSSLSGHGSELDPRIRVIRPGDGVIEESSSRPAGLVYAEGALDGLPTVALCFIANEAGSYLVEISDVDGESGPAHAYIVELR